MAEEKHAPASLDECSDSRALAEFVAAGQARLRDAFRASPSGRAHSLALTELFDAVIRRLFLLASREAEADVPPTGIEIAVLATGGYGRRELCPRSDIDVAFIAAGEEDPYLAAVVRRMFFLIMDVFTVHSDLKVGYAFRVLDDCPELDPQTRTALLDGRLIAGSEALARRFHAELLRTMRPAAFLYDRLAERERLRRKYGGSVHCTEPDLKECAGGLRDLHFMGWAARAQSSQPLDDPWAYLVAIGDIEPGERARAAEAHEFLLRVRHALHYARERRFDRLSRERQEAVAAALGYADGRALMTDYFAHAEWIHAGAVRVGERLRRRMLPLTDGLVVKEGEIDTADPSATWPDLASIVALFRHSQVYGLPLCADLGERILAVASDLPPEPSGGAAGRLFLEMLRDATGVEAVLRQMTRWGVLQRLVPEFGEALRLVPQALVHEYTIGEHSLRVVGFLEQARASAAPERAYAQAFSELQRLDLLFLAALLHDIGKRTEGVRHAEVGATEAHAVALRLGLDPEAAEMVAFLVRHHLLMSDTARLRDLTETQVIRDFTATVATAEQLNSLFLLTYADLRATGGGVWTPVQERFLEDLYYRAHHAITAPEPEEDLMVRVQRRRRRMQRELTLENLPPEAVQEHCNAMPPSYLLNTPAEVIAQHIRLVERVKVEGPVVEFLDSPGRDFTTLTLCTFDDPQPGLLSKIAAALYAHSVNVHAAQVFTREGQPGIAIDTLWVDRDGRRLRSFERAEIERDLKGVLSGQITVESLLQRRGKLPQADLSAADVRVHNDVSEARTVIEVRARDCSGLLYRLTHRLSTLGWDIHSARINTIGGDVRDAFYVTNHQGEKLVDDPAVIRARLLEP